MSVLRHLESQGITMKNLHPNNVFIKSDNPNDVLITDVGFADIPGIISNNESL